MKKDRVDRRSVKAWMAIKRLRACDIQRALGHSYKTQVVETLLGDRNNREVLNWLRDNGCPVRYLQLPECMQEEAA